MIFCSFKISNRVFVFQVDLLKEMFVSGVATQGSKFYDCWVNSYKLLYRGNGQVWIKYTEADIEQVRRVNVGSDTERFLISTCMVVCFLAIC